MVEVVVVWEVDPARLPSFLGCSTRQPSIPEVVVERRGWGGEGGEGARLAGAVAYECGFPKASSVP